jgi:hypothetical protein
MHGLGDLKEQESLAMAVAETTSSIRGEDAELVQPSMGS